MRPSPARFRPLARVFATILLGMTAVRAQAPNPSYLRDLPSVERVLQGVSGSDSIDTAARQAGVLWQLRDVITRMALSQRRNDRQWTPDERRLFNEYHAAYYKVWQPLEKDLAQDRPRLFKLQGYTVDRDLLNDALERLAAPGFRAQYARAVGEIDARIQARMQADQREMEAAKQQQQQALAQLQGGQQKPWQKDLARCLASGRSETQCFTEGAGKGFLEMFPFAKSTEQPAGLSFSGIYSAPGSIGLVFYPNGVSVACRGVTAHAGYVIERKANQLQIALRAATSASMTPLGSDLIEKLAPQTAAGNPEQWQGQRLAFPLRADGKLAAAGTIRVTGQVQVGSTTQQSTKREEISRSQAQFEPFAQKDVVTGGYYVEKQVSTSVPVYETRTVTCPLGAMAATGRTPFGGTLSGTLAGTLEMAFGALGAGESGAKVKSPPPGLRMNGTYIGPTGFDIEFHPESAVLSCRNAVSAREYAVAARGGQVLVQIEDSSRPIVFELQPDGTLTAAGSVRVDGRMYAGNDPNNEPVFQAVSETCTPGVLVATTGATPAASTVPSGSATARAVNVPAAASPTAAGGSAVLSLVNGFVVPGGVKNPLAEKTFFLLKDSAENVLTKGGIRPQQGMSAFKSWLMACGSAAPACKQGQTAIDSNSASVLRTDAQGNARFPALPPGTYYVWGITRYNGQLLLWDVRTDLKPGANAVTLDERNATSLQ